MTKLNKIITTAASIATIVGTFMLFIPNQAVSDSQTSYGNQSPNIKSSNGNVAVSYGGSTKNNNYNIKSGIFLKATMLSPQPLLSTSRNFICQVEDGSRVEMLGEQKDANIGVSWIKVKVIDGSCAGKEGWAGKEKLVRK